MKRLILKASLNKEVSLFCNAQWAMTKDGEIDYFLDNLDISRDIRKS